MKTLFAVSLALACFVITPRVYCADPKTELEDLVAKVNTKMQAGPVTEADLAPELNQFDALLAEHKAENTDAVADLLFLKAMVYAQVLKDDTKATAELQQLKTEFPDTADAKKADNVIASLAQQAAGNKIQRSLAVGTVFPDFQETDVNGKSLSVANEKGKIVLIDFWATWCGPCVHELPNVIKVYGDYHDKGFDIIGVSLDEDKSKLSSFLREKQMTWPQYFDGKGWANKLAGTYGVNSIPATYLLDKDGKIIGKDLRGDALERAVKLALATK